LGEKRKIAKKKDTNTSPGLGMLSDAAEIPGQKERKSDLGKLIDRGIFLGQLRGVIRKAKVIGVTLVLWRKMWGGGRGFRAADNGDAVAGKRRGGEEAMFGGSEHREISTNTHHRRQSMCRPRGPDVSDWIWPERHLTTSQGTPPESLACWFLERDSFWGGENVSQVLNPQGRGTARRHNAKFHEPGKGGRGRKPRNRGLKERESCFESF